VVTVLRGWINHVTRELVRSSKSGGIVGFLKWPFTKEVLCCTCSGRSMYILVITLVRAVRTISSIVEESRPSFLTTFVGQQGKLVAVAGSHTGTRSTDTSSLEQFEV